MTSATELKKRRSRLIKEIGADAVALVPAALPALRNRDIHHPYRQDSDLLYLTGFAEEQALAAFVPRRKEGEFVLFCQPKNEEKEAWEGPLTGVEGAVERYGANEAHPIAEIDDKMADLLADRERVYYPIGSDEHLDARVVKWLKAVRRKTRSGVRAPRELVDLGKVLHQHRLVKSKGELTVMRKAARISAQAHCDLMRACRPGIWEYELEALFAKICGDKGARFQAYPPIVGAGGNACVLHYVASADQLRDGDLVLVDAGGEYAGYASDITRTFPVNGRFNPAQRELYQLVLDAQLAAIAKVAPGRRWNESHDAAVRVLTQGLIELGLLDTAEHDLASLIKEEKYKRFYRHKTGHWLGMDVHDVGDYKVDGKWRTLEPGMVLTVEPGLYIPGDDEIPEAYRNIGIRIEDDLVVTEDGNEIISDAVPKTIDAIEALMSRG